MNILLVDDDHDAIDVLRPILESIPGVTVRSATSGEAALEQAVEWGGIDLLLTDVAMEPMNGFTLRNKLENRLNGFKTIFMSGYSLDEYAEYTNGSPVLVKPFEADALRDLVKREMPPPPKPGLIGAPPAAPKPPLSAPVPPKPVAKQPGPAPVAQPEPKPVESKPEPVETPGALPPEPEIPAAQPGAPGAAASKAEPVEPSSPEPKAPEPPVAAAPAPPPGPKLPTPLGIPPAGQPALRGAALVGKTLGNYKIISLQGEGKTGSVYEAMQTSMNRPVALKVLSPDLQQDDTTREQFIADAQAKAKVQHPAILSVYEAGESGPYCYYTLEYVEGGNMAAYVRENRTIDDSLALQLVRAAGEGLLYLDQQKISHNPLEAQNLYIDTNKHPRLANVATQHESHPQTQKEIITLSQIVRKVLPDGRATDPALQALLHRMSVSGNAGFLSWGGLLQAVRALEPKLMPAAGFKITAQDVAAMHAVEETKSRMKRAVFIKAGAVVLALALAFAAYWFFFRSNERNLDKMVEIPAGEFIFQNERKILPTFWIDQYEVTIGQYAKFLKYLDDHPGEASKFDHPNQPRTKTSHKPKDWDRYYDAARAFLRNDRVVDSVHVDLNYPVFGVDWWDAFAYAKWQGRRLPTEMEWEKAGRGTTGRLYPWGNEPDPKKCNSASDFAGDGRAPGSVDGYSSWSPVDAMTGDCSSFNVFDMAGNVSEWTSDPPDPSAKYRVIRGGSCHSVDDAGQPDVKLTKRITSLAPGDSSPYVGFRTVSDQPPEKK